MSDDLNDHIKKAIEAGLIIDNGDSYRVGDESKIPVVDGDPGYENKPGGWPRRDN